MTISVWNWKDPDTEKGSADGHNGSKILSHSWALRTSRESKLSSEKSRRAGIWRYVLGHSSKEDRGLVDDALKRAAGAVELMVTGRSGIRR